MPTYANRTTAFSMCATLNCAEPVPFIDAPMVFHYEDCEGRELCCRHRLLLPPTAVGAFDPSELVDFMLRSQS